ncbi:MAG: hypothetical protein JO006_06645 [Paucibacter sp.]|nr:hypothetical protein [Roseateles sp.]
MLTHINQARSSTIPVAAVMVMVVSMLVTSASATSPQPVTWSYPALHGLCILEAAAAANGESAAYPIGQVVATKTGKWVCTAVIARQVPVELAGVWIKLGQQPAKVN